eukprot:gnl/MRDRNA2_/MRDRNA2_58787_c0_seq1.p1 gnl/MRDRNA2_/MRDRNA2_58787_c0~~gnl/MRDRNA2_/MRDRNA2_58787_c0_seq1.p1  ORF type:complete len:517 (+),score=60.12 gnl/MRDRNA2_/MRDRNA2_58787_c0_seq1:207-1757(+)
MPQSMPSSPPKIEELLCKIVDLEERLFLVEGVFEDHVPQEKLSNIAETEDGPTIHPLEMSARNPNEVRHRESSSSRAVVVDQLNDSHDGDDRPCLSPMNTLPGIATSLRSLTGSMSKLQRKTESHPTLHASFIVSATQPNVSCAASAAYMLLTLLLLLLQVLVANSVRYEGSMPRCTKHSQCNVGLFCSPTWVPPFSIEPGMCDDCDYAVYFLHDKEGKDHPAARAAGAEWLNASVVHCNATDTMPGQCDHLVESRKLLTPVTLMVLLLTVGLIMLSIFQDIRQGAEEQKLLMHRMQNMQGIQRNTVRVLWWISSQLRRFQLPHSIVGATVGLLLSGPLTSQNILLNGLAITFLTQVDDLLAQLVDTDNACEALEEERAATLNRDGTKDVEKLLWSCDVIYASALFSSLVFLVLAPEMMMMLTFNVTGAQGVQGGGPNRRCELIQDIATIVPSIISIAACILRSLVGYCVTCRCSCCKHSAFRGNRTDLLLAPLLIMTLTILFQFSMFGLHGGVSL